MTSSTVSRAWILLASLVLLFGLTVGPAAAHHSEEHDGGGGTAQSAEGGGSSNANGNGSSNANGGSSASAGGGKQEDSGKPSGPKPGNPGASGGGIADTGQGGKPADTGGDKPSVSGGGKPAADPVSKHPSGQNKEQNPGPADDEQGKSPSDPDGMENGGADKPGGTGGVYDWDQDGNNGCGNDTDFEDDNRGNCGGPQKEREGCPKVLPEQASRGKGKKLGHDKRDCAAPGLVPVLLLGTGTGTTGVGGITFDDTANDDLAGVVGNVADIGGLVPFGRIGADALVERGGGRSVRVLGLALNRTGDAPDVAGGSEHARGASILGVPLPLTGDGGVLFWLVLAAALLAAGTVLLRVRPHVSA